MDVGSYGSSVTATALSNQMLDQQNASNTWQSQIQNMQIQQAQHEQKMLNAAHEHHRETMNNQQKIAREAQSDAMKITKDSLQTFSQEAAP
ncbi:hypothetical protein [Martelella sp. HB161492]|uniref:hypothetical protein n=1 Tax=Martelella sp. HB161492 TaxID=2720726 RepID=UPI001591636C|nr:hypothetical protein [Martelella sp. HB161492]